LIGSSRRNIIRHGLKATSSEININAGEEMCVCVRACITEQQCQLTMKPGYLHVICCFMSMGNRLLVTTRGSCCLRRKNKHAMY
jgi:hypothetical protein